MAIPTKAESSKLYKQGKFGNPMFVYRDFDHWLGAIHSEPKSQRYGMRYADPRGGGSNWFMTELTPSEMSQTLQIWISEGAILENISFYRSLPHRLLLIQGEIQRSINYFDLTCTRETDQPNRPRMWKYPEYHTGLRAKLLLEYFMWPKSYDCLQDLFDLYPDSVIEFSVVNCEVGETPGHNTIFWEVRNY